MHDSHVYQPNTGPGSGEPTCTLVPWRQGSRQTSNKERLYGLVRPYLVGERVIPPHLYPNSRVGANEPVHWFLGGKGLGKLVCPNPVGERVISPHLYPNSSVGAKQPVHWFLGGKGLGMHPTKNACTS